MESTGNNIYCRFWANLQGGWIKAGVITNIHDTSTFIPLVTVSGSDVSGFAQGAYFVRITGEQNTAIRKLIVK